MSNQGVFWRAVATTAVLVTSPTAADAACSALEVRFNPNSGRHKCARVGSVPNR